MNNGTYNISNEEYHANDAVSRSNLTHLLKSPYHYYMNKYHADEKEDSKALVMGNLVHCLSLEPEQFEKRYIVQPKFDRRTKQGKADYQEFLEQAEGREVIEQQMFSDAKKIGESLRNTEFFPDLIDDAVIERAIFFTHKGTGLQCKVKPDAWLNSIITDVKTTADASYRAFQSSAYKYGYYLQAGMIHEALASCDIKMEKFVFACVENKSPWATVLYELDNAAIDFGIEQFDALMHKLKKCIDEDNWPSYEMQTLCLPNWARYSIFNFPI